MAIVAQKERQKRRTRVSSEVEESLRNGVLKICGGAILGTGGDDNKKSPISVGVISDSCPCESVICNGALISVNPMTRA